MTYPEFKARYALTPDPQQEAAILRAEGPTLLLAVPGPTADTEQRDWSRVGILN